MLRLEIKNGRPGFLLGHNVAELFANARHLIGARTTVVRNRLGSMRVSVWACLLLSCSPNPKPIAEEPILVGCPNDQGNAGAIRYEAIAGANRASFVVSPALDSVRDAEARYDVSVDIGGEAIFRLAGNVGASGTRVRVLYWFTANATSRLMGV